MVEGRGATCKIAAISTTFNCPFPYSGLRRAAICEIRISDIWWEFRSINLVGIPPP